MILRLHAIKGDQVPSKMGHLTKYVINDRGRQKVKGRPKGQRSSPTQCQGKKRDNWWDRGQVKNNKTNKLVISRKALYSHIKGLSQSKDS